MRIIQLIDSLEAGGAERMAVNYANSLSSVIAFSALIATRKSGPLQDQLGEKVSFLCLEKKNSIDIKAVLKLRKFVSDNRITVIHAHSTSFFTAFLVKLLYPRIKLIWHDHYGDSEFLSQRPTFALKSIMPFFSGIISVNLKLSRWAEKKLSSRKVTYLPNFPVISETSAKATKLKGQEGKRIVCLANLRAQKDHFLLLAVVKELKKIYQDWTFHLVGKDFEDAYADKVKKEIVAAGLEEFVYLYGSRDDVGNILDNCEIAVLTSKSEGLPVALLEYGLYGKPVVVTDVGEIGAIIKNGENGLIVPSGNRELFLRALVELIGDSDLRKKTGNNLKNLIAHSYSEKAIINQYISWIKSHDE